VEFFASFWLPESFTAPTLKLVILADYPTYRTHLWVDLQQGILSTQTEQVEFDQEMLTKYLRPIKHLKHFIP